MGEHTTGASESNTAFDKVEPCPAFLKRAVSRGIPQETAWAGALAYAYGLVVARQICGCSMCRAAL